MTPYIEAYLPICSRFEGPIPWMYLDTVGNVTAAIGEMLISAERACLLPFQFAERAATDAEITADFNRVSAMPFGQTHTASFYRCADSPMLTGDAMLSLLRLTVEQVDDELRTKAQWYGEIPDTWKMAVLDMGYNLGVARFLKEFPHFIYAIVSGNWQAAMAQCRRPQLCMQRNDWTAEQFHPGAVVNFPATVQLSS